MKSSIKLILAFTVFAALFSCEKILDLEPVGTGIEESEALQTKSDMQEFLNSTYDVMASAYSGRLQNLGELLSDNLDRPFNHNDFTEIYNHDVLIFNGTVAPIYQDPYIGIFRANRIMEYLDEKDFGFTQAELDRMKGECLFLRALGHFDLVRLFAQPWGYTGDNSHPGIIYETSSEITLVPRPSVAAVYEGMISDLQQAVNLLPPSNSIYATSYSAQGLLAKIYFQQGRYAEAAGMASEVINSGVFELDPAINRFRTDVSVEAVFTTVSTKLPDNRELSKSYGFADNYGKSNNDNPTLRLSREFYDTYAADTTDRRLDLIEVLNPGELNEVIILRKYSGDYFNIPVIHLTDLKLLRAEALAETNTDLATALQDVNDIRERAYGGTHNNLPSNASAGEIIEAARYERRFEMVGEGDRIQQLKRRGAIEAEPTSVRGDIWNCNGMIIQFPSTQRTEVFPLNPTGGC